MPACRFYEGVHTYGRDDCDKAHCLEILGHSVRLRPVPLPVITEPSSCEHEWDTLFVRLRAPASMRRNPGVGFLVQDTSISVCAKCGRVHYHHQQMGVQLICDPVQVVHDDDE